MRGKRKNPELLLMLRMLDEAYEKKAWHGPNLKGAVRGLTAQQAAWKPTPQRHCIWELVRHAAYWKYAVRRRLIGEKRGSFPKKGSNWFAGPSSVTQRAWKEELALLDEMHYGVRKAISNLAPGRLHRKPPGSKIDNAMMIYGIAFHDIYHAGQIQLLKRLQKKG